MQIEELQFVCQEAARDLAARQADDRPLTPSVVLPGPDRTRVLNLEGFPDDDERRHELLANLALDEIQGREVPCYGFVAEAEAEGGDVVVVVYGARRHTPQVTAAPLGEDGTVGEFEDPEELDPTALPFLHPLQHAVDSLEAEQPPEPSGQGGLPIAPDQ